jgi:hypothetical protein
MNVEDNIAKEMALFRELGAHPVRRGGVIFIPKARLQAALLGFLGEVFGFSGLMASCFIPMTGFSPFLRAALITQRTGSRRRMRSPGF